MARYINQAQVKDGLGRVIQGASVTVYLAGTTTVATVYAAFTDSSPAAAITTDNSGYFRFYIDDFDYASNQTFDVLVTSTGYQSITYHNVAPNLIVGNYTVSSAKTISTYHKVPQGVTYTKAATGAINFTGTFEAGPYTVFSGFSSGDIMFAAGAVKEILPEWWGGMTHTTIADAMASSNGQIVTLLPGTWTIGAGLNITTPISISDGAKFSGAGQVTFAAGTVRDVQPEWWGAVGNGVTNDYAALVSCIASIASTGGRVKFGNTTYAFGTTLVLSNNITYSGVKKTSNGLGTVLLYTGNSDAIQINNPKNSTTAANIVIEDLTVQSVNNTAGKACIADLGSSFLFFSKVTTTGNRIGFILDQSELVHFLDCEILSNASGDCGIWLVNGAQHTAGALGSYTNRITIENCQFNGHTGAVGIADDGGYSHNFYSNNFNAVGTAIRTGATVSTIDDNHFESAAASGGLVTFADTSWFDGTAISTPGTIRLIGNHFFTSDAGLPAVKLLCGVASLEMGTNNFNTAGDPISGMASAVDVDAMGNTQVGLGSSALNNRKKATYTTAWTAAVANPTIGDGTLSAYYIRTPNECTVSITLIVGSTTTMGTGAYSFSLPVANVSSAYINGIAYDLHAAAYHQGFSFISSQTISAYLFGGTAAWGSATYTWVAGDQLNINISYAVATASLQ